MMADVGLMRERFKRVALDRRWWGEWSEADEREFAAAIREAVESGEAERIENWARWLASECSDLDAMAAVRAEAQAKVVAMIQAKDAEKQQPARGVGGVGAVHGNQRRA